MRLFRCGEVLDVQKFEVYRNLRWRDILHYMCFVAIYAVLSQNLSRFTHFLCGDKLSPKLCPRRKNDKYYVCVKMQQIWLNPLRDWIFQQSTWVDLWLPFVNRRPFLLGLTSFIGCRYFKGFTNSLMRSQCYKIYYCQVAKLHSAHREVLYKMNAMISQLKRSKRPPSGLFSCRYSSAQ